MNFQGLKIFLVCLIAVLWTIVDAKRPEVGTMRIFGGEKISIDMAPYIVQIRYDSVGTYCGGTLVSKRFVVTAAHCIKDMNVTLLTVVGGATTIIEEGIQRKVEKALIPDSYDSQTVHNDVAVLKLDKDMEGTNTQPIELCDQKLEPDDMIQVSGWGLIATNSTQSENLLTIFIPVLPKKECAENYASGKNPTTLTDSMFCAAEPGVKDSCNEDSGGPAVFGEQLCGVVSWGIVCGDAKHPGVYTDIMSVRDFIVNAMKE